jgi:prepilin-type N-terminal cleavage/methylation domain-containing protein
MATDARSPSSRRLAATVPTLATLARRAPSPRRAFTLIELMVAVAISSIIVLTAVSSFRMITKAIATANALSVENGLLRSGMLLSLQDVDYWHSHADANPPYNKKWARVQQKRDDTTTTDAIPNAHNNDIFENSWRRPFQPVHFAPRTDTAERDPFTAQPTPYPNQAGPGRNCGYYNAGNPGSAANFDQKHTDGYFTDPYNRNDFVPNPNAMLANDPRSINRVSVYPMRVPDVPTSDIYTVKHYGGYRLGSSKLVSGDYSLVGATDMRDPTIANYTKRYPVNTGMPATYPGTPAKITTYKSWEFWHNTALANFQDQTAATVDIPLDTGAAMYQPLLWTSLWQRLNYYGCFEYMTPGTAILWSDRYGRTSDINTVPLPPFTYRPDGGTAPPGGNWFQYVIEEDYAFNLGTCDLATRMGERFMPSPANGGRTGRTIECIPIRPCWPSLGSDNDLNYGQVNFDYFMYKTPFAVFIGTGDYDWNNGSDYAQMFAQWTLGVHFLEERADVTRTDSDSLSTTVWLPYNATDADRAQPTVGTDVAPTTGTFALPKPLDYKSKPTQVPVMKTSIMRYGRIAGSQDMTVTRVTIEDPISGRKTELTTMPFGTTYRGARQHWRLYSRDFVPTAGLAVSPGHRFANCSDDCIGDYYDTAAGPYYVP